MIDQLLAPAALALAAGPDVTFRIGLLDALALRLLGIFVGVAVPLVLLRLL